MTVPACLVSPLLKTVPPPKISYQAKKSGGTATVYTFTDIPLGSDAPDRDIIVGVTGGQNAQTISSVTCNGVEMAPVVNQYGGVSASMYILRVPTGALGTFVVTWTGAKSFCGLLPFRATGLLSTAPTHTNKNYGSDVSSLSAPINYQADGIIVGVCEAQTGAAIAWTNLTENDEYVVLSGFRDTAASKTSPAGATGEPITVTGTFTTVALAVASWR